MGPELLIPLIVPMITEMIKWLLGKVMNDVPPALVPLLTAVSGAALATVPGMDVSLLQGLEYGLAGVGVHQVTRTTGLLARQRRSRATDRVKMAWLLLISCLALSGCAWFDKLKSSDAAGQFCAAVPHATACMEAVKKKVVATDPKLAADLGRSIQSLTIAAAATCK